MKKVGIVILHYKGIEDTIQCLDSVLKAEDKGLEIKLFLVNNSPGEESTKDIPKTNKLTLVNSTNNTGFAGGNNLGIKRALSWKPDYLVLLNNDTRVSKNLLTNLVKQAEKTEKIGLVSPKIYFEKGYEFHKDRYKRDQLGKVIWYAGGKIDWQNMLGKHIGVDEVDKGQFDKEKEIDFATGCCLLVKKEVFERIGLFDNKLFLYQEDLDFSIRARKAEYRILYSPKAYLWHKNSGSSGSGSALHDYYLTRNRLLIGWRYAPLRTKLALFKESLKRLFTGRKWEKIGIKDFYLGRLGKGSYEA